MVRVHRRATASSSTSRTHISRPTRRSETASAYNCSWRSGGVGSARPAPSTTSTIERTSRMRIGSADGPGEERAHKSTHVIYDTRSGHIVATHHFIDAAPSPEQHRVNQLLKDAHEKSRVPLDHLAILTNPNFPHGEGEMRADHAQSRGVGSALQALGSARHRIASPAARTADILIAFRGHEKFGRAVGDPVSPRSLPDPQSALGFRRGQARQARRKCRARSIGR